MGERRQHFLRMARAQRKGRAGAKDYSQLRYGSHVPADRDLLQATVLVSDSASAHSCIDVVFIHARMSRDREAQIYPLRLYGAPLSSSGSPRTAITLLILKSLIELDKFQDDAGLCQFSDILAWQKYLNMSGTVRGGRRRTSESTKVRWEKTYSAWEGHAISPHGDDRLSEDLHSFSRSTGLRFSDLFDWCDLKDIKGETHEKLWILGVPPSSIIVHRCSAYERAGKAQESLRNILGKWKDPNNPAGRDDVLTKLSDASLCVGLPDHITKELQSISFSRPDTLDKWMPSRNARSAVDSNRVPHAIDFDLIHRRGEPGLEPSLFCRPQALWCDVDLWPSHTQVAAVVVALAQGTRRVLLRGSPGSGKTTLLIQLGVRLRKQDLGSVAWVDPFMRVDFQSLMELSAECVVLVDDVHVLCARSHGFRGVLSKVAARVVCAARDASIGDRISIGDGISPPLHLEVSSEGLEELLVDRKFPLCSFQPISDYRDQGGVLLPPLDAGAQVIGGRSDSDTQSPADSSSDLNSVSMSRSVNGAALFSSSARVRIEEFLASLRRLDWGGEQDGDGSERIAAKRRTYGRSLNLHVTSWVLQAANSDGCVEIETVHRAIRDHLGRLPSKVPGAALNYREVRAILLAIAQFQLIGFGMPYEFLVHRRISTEVLEWLVRSGLLLTNGESVTIAEGIAFTRLVADYCGADGHVILRDVLGGSGASKRVRQTIGEVEQGRHWFGAWARSKYVQLLERQARLFALYLRSWPQEAIRLLAMRIDQDDRPAEFGCMTEWNPLTNGELRTRNTVLASLLVFYPETLIGAVKKASSVTDVLYVLMRSLELLNWRTGQDTAKLRIEDLYKAVDWDLVLSWIRRDDVLGMDGDSHVELLSCLLKCTALQRPALARRLIPKVWEHILIRCPLSIGTLLTIVGTDREGLPEHQSALRSWFTNDIVVQTGAPRTLRIRPPLHADVAKWLHVLDELRSSIPSAVDPWTRALANQLPRCDLGQLSWEDQLWLMDTIIRADRHLLFTALMQPSRLALRTLLQKKGTDVLIKVHCDTPSTLTPDELLQLWKKHPDAWTYDDDECDGGPGTWYRYDTWEERTLHLIGHMNWPDLDAIARPQACNARCLPEHVSLMIQRRQLIMWLECFASR